MLDTQKKMTGTISQYRSMDARKSMSAAKNRRNVSLEYHDDL